jgi:hypothetical protein
MSKERKRDDGGLDRAAFWLEPAMPSAVASSSLGSKLSVHGETLLLEGPHYLSVMFP